MASEGNLFDVRRKRARQAVQAVPAGAIHHLIGLYAAGYRRRLGEPPVITGRDGAQLKRLVLQFGAEKVESRLLVFLASNDDFYIGSGFAIGVFTSCWNRLAAQCVRPDASVEYDRDSMSDTTSEYLDSIRAKKRQAKAGL